MKFSLLFALLFTTLFSFAQVSGTISLDGRKIIEDISYTMEMKATGKLIFDIAVDVKGNVTSCTFNRAESTIRSTVYAHAAKNIIIMNLKFEKGNGFPTFHQGKVTISSTITD